MVFTETKPDPFDPSLMRRPWPLRLADETCKFIGANRERPFFAYLSFYSVHIPLQATKEGIAKYEAKAARLPAGQVEFGRERESKWRLATTSFRR